MSVTRNAVLRIQRDIKDVQNGSDLSIAVAFKDEDMKKCRALIIGPVETPYEFGFFEFDVKFGDDYPTVAPKVNAITTNAGRTRFNPNIYAEGKVCLSILGTWRGESGEQWSSAQGLESILWSIQSLMCSNPYENEPGFESTSLDKKEAKAYAAKIRHETLRISVCKRLEDHFNMRDESQQVIDAPTFGDDLDFEQPWEPFIELCKTRFGWYLDSYLESIDAEKKKHGHLVGDGKKFTTTDFESDGNRMVGEYLYSVLDNSLLKIHAKLEDETAKIVEEGNQALIKENPKALLYQNIFGSIKRKYENSGSPMELEMVNKNPFDWRIILFGKPMTNLEGGIFKIRLSIPMDFPDRQPRVKVETPLFHHRVSSRGALCYLPEKSGEVTSHIDGIIHAIEDEDFRYDPRTLVNPPAARLLWGSAEDKKLYRRKLRRSAQDSSEF